MLRVHAFKAQAKHGCFGTCSSRRRFATTSPRSLAKVIPKPNRRIEQYDPAIVETGWYEWWESKGYFAARPVSTSSTDPSSSRTTDNKATKSFTMLTPPPNVTGYLHIGHALTSSLQDSIIRWSRMKGDSVSWIPGQDHAGISTQTVVEKKLMREQKLTRHDLGRDAFVEKIWDWKQVHGDGITHQLRKMGASLDWDQSFFTLDETRSKAVQSAFVKLYKDGLVYRDTRLVNWCCALETVISDIEVEHEDISGRTMLTVPGRLKKVEFGVLHDFAYKVDGGAENEELIVSTTRIETMLGDEAVAIHPEDPRYLHLHGKYVIHPLNGKRLPVICDSELVDMEFGTGVVKVTPAHDPNDYACGRRHGLPMINILNNNGSFNAACGSPSYVNLNRFDARDKVIQDLKEVGVYRGKKEDHAMRLARCSRSGDVIEPMVMPQWYIQCDGMAQRALESAASKDLVFYPESAIKDWNRWLENIQDWCISRQLWWGHRIPAYKVVFDNPIQARQQLAVIGKVDNQKSEDGPWFVADSSLEAESQIQQYLADNELGGLGYRIEQDADVLDTWFSSGLLPLSALGWAGTESNQQLPSRYPTNMIETGTDIMFFWVARMVMLCTHLSGQVPFRDIMFHAMVRDAQGRKMSKSVGNVIDPTHVIQGISLKDLKATLDGSNLAAKEIKRSQTQMEKDFPRGIKASGADALRYTLVSSTQQTRQINLDLSNVTAAHHFANKLWNLSAFSATRFEAAGFETNVHSSTVVAHGLLGQKGSLSLVERFIMSRLAHAVDRVNQGMEERELSTATDAVRRFVIQDLCDVYVEFCKPALFGTDTSGSGSGRNDTDNKKSNNMLMVLQTCVDASLRMLHPFMPFVTEELWQRLSIEDSFKDESIMVSAFPQPTEMSHWKDDAADSDMQTVLDVIQASRSLRTTYQVPMSQSLPFTLWTDDQSLVEAGSGALIQGSEYLQHFIRADGQLTIVQGSKALESIKTDDYAVHVVSPHLKLLAPLSNIQEITRSLANTTSTASSSSKPVVADASKSKQELNRLSKKLSTVCMDLEKLEGRLAKPEYSERVPAEVKAMDQKRKKDLLAQKDHLEANINILSKSV